MSLTFGDKFNQSWVGVTSPNTLTSGDYFDQNVEGVTFPHSLQNLTCGSDTVIIFVPTQLQAAWCFLMELETSEAEFSLEGATHLTTPFEHATFVFQRVL